jgi:hypothetical protein
VGTVNHPCAVAHHKRHGEKLEKAQEGGGDEQGRVVTA